MSDDEPGSGQRAFTAQEMLQISANDPRYFKALPPDYKEKLVESVRNLYEAQEETGDVLIQKARGMAYILARFIYENYMRNVPAKERFFRFFWDELSEDQQSILQFVMSPQGFKRAMMLNELDDEYLSRFDSDPAIKDEVILQRKSFEDSRYHDRLSDQEKISLETSLRSFTEKIDAVRQQSSQPPLDEAERDSIVRANANMLARIILERRDATIPPGHKFEEVISFKTSPNLMRIVDEFDNVNNDADLLSDAQTDNSYYYQLTGREKHELHKAISALLSEKPELRKNSAGLGYLAARFIVERGDERVPEQSRLETWLAAQEMIPEGTLEIAEAVQRAYPNDFEIRRRKREVTEPMTPAEP